MSQDDIDAHLARYLVLLDEYTTLRAELARLQSAVHQGIARANFSAERGMRYGQDHYDERMQAARVLALSADDAGVAVFTVGEAAVSEDAAVEDRRKDGEEDKAAQDRDKDKDKSVKRRNPLHWFGLFAPTPLRTAQGHSIEVVERVIPQLLSVSAQMQHLEIEVGRARKRRAKAEAALKKGAAGETRSTGTGTSVAAS